MGKLLPEEMITSKPKSNRKDTKKNTEYWANGGGCAKFWKDSANMPTDGGRELL